MQCKKSLGVDGFQPFTFHVRIESQAEAEAWYAVLNKSTNLFILDPNDKLDLRNVLIGEEFYIDEQLFPDKKINGSHITLKEFIED